jgi:lipopolysaccharide/colanic/teichoic acid biosynthesis glycosyltransferase
MPTGPVKDRPSIEKNSYYKTEAIAVQFRRKWSRYRIERMIDLVLAGVLIAFTLPLMMIVMIAIKCESRGPAFQRQASIGRSGRLVLLTFRTTLHRPEYASNRYRRSETTRVGGFLRYTRIDTLPQLINVLRGEITLIGTGRKRLEFLDAA